MHPSLAHWDQPAAASSKLPLKEPKQEQPKKPRHRHSPMQLAALNELYDKTEHPSLEDRTALAERLGMETKTVNSWFQNKRASSKKRHKAPLTQCELPPISALIASVSAPPSSSLSPHQLEYDELISDDELYQPLSAHSASSAHPPPQHTLFYAGDPQQQHLFDSDSSMPRKARSRPSQEQTEELKKFYELKPHPTKEEREALGVKIGMRYQSVTNWFQNQRSIAKKREEAAAARAATAPQSRAFSPLAIPPSSSALHPSLAVPPPTSHPSLAALLHPPRAHRSPSVALSGSSLPSSPRASPYPVHPAERALDATHRRPRRTRPEPWQLDALKKLFNRTKTPSIEDRQRLAAEIGMDLGKVTNWFRNLRQSDRKRSRQSGSVSGDDMDDDTDAMDIADDDSSTQASFTRTATPSSSSTPGIEFVKIETEETVRQPQPLYTRVPLARSQSDVCSDEDYPEAVTPSPQSSPPPSAVASTSSLALPLAHHPHARETKASIQRYPLEYARYGNEKKALPTPAVLSSGVKMEDALLLLSFSHGTVVH
ncbi:homeobox-domain-containing protein [Polyporus arcularius HHB13444]|uniref:Homeobox-domain-containing protein n=1 Tax=Polyporus arcularius HHB13444 TaxID=1314778 RepID=A0A5C3PE97_9APHY|nr:homeobox-domain-containing protein [Polyporus arcularius HHB13444]